MAEIHNAFIHQKIAKELDGPLNIANTYLSIIFTLNNIHVKKREKELLAFISYRGISSVTSRQEFCSIYHTSQATINNMVSRLTKIGLLIREAGKIKIHPAINLDFNKDLSLNISLKDAHR